MNTVTTRLVVRSARSEWREREPLANPLGLPAKRTARIGPRNTESSTVLNDDARGATKQDTTVVAVPT